jgi:hypothetical protein
MKITTTNIEVTMINNSTENKDAFIKKFDNVYVPSFSLELGNSKYLKVDDVKKIIDEALTINENYVLTDSQIIIEKRILQKLYLCRYHQKKYYANKYDKQALGFAKLLESELDSTIKGYIASGDILTEEKRTGNRQNNLF